MSRIALSDTSDWQLQFKEQDVRGFDVVGSDGERLGTVSEMIADTEQECVTSLVLSDGSEIPADDVSIGDGVVHLTHTPDALTHPEAQPYRDRSQVQRRSTPPAQADYDSHSEAFRRHHEQHYAQSGTPFEDAEPGYRFGYETAHQAEFRNRRYAEAESELESSYRQQHPDRDYEGAREAVRFGYGRAHYNRLGDDEAPSRSS